MMRKRRPELSPTPVSVPVVPAKAVEPDLAAVIQALATAGRWNEARERYDELVVRHQRRAVRLACYYLRDAAEADEAVQDAFVKAFAHLASFDPARSFEVWFTRILVNSCLDRVKARKRRLRWQIAHGRYGRRVRAGQRAGARDGATVARSGDAAARAGAAAPVGDSEAAPAATHRDHVEPSRWAIDARGQ